MSFCREYSNDIMCERGLDLWFVDVSNRSHVIALGSFVDSSTSTNIFIQKGRGLDRKSI
jgi:hypothetical protein